MSKRDAIAETVKVGKPAERALARAGILTFAELAMWRAEDFLALHGVGPRSVDILAPAMAERGVTFKP